MASDPLILVDGAHNDYSAARLRKALESLYPNRQRIFILGISANKDIGGIVSNLVPGSKAVVVTRARHARAAALDVIRREVHRAGIAAIEMDTLSQALEKARQLVIGDEMIVITGSLFLVGEALELIGKKG